MTGKLDLERLHDVLTHRAGGRGAGRTYAKLVEALQQSDFDVSTIWIIARDPDHICREVLNIAKELDLQIVWIHKRASSPWIRRQFRIRNTTYTVFPPTLPRAGLEGITAGIYVDHAVDE